MESLLRSIDFLHNTVAITDEEWNDFIHLIASFPKAEFFEYLLSRPLPFYFPSIRFDWEQIQNTPSPDFIPEV